MIFLFIRKLMGREVLHLLGGGIVQRSQHAGYKVVDVHEIALQRVALRGATQAEVSGGQDKPSRQGLVLWELAASSLATSSGL